MNIMTGIFAIIFVYWATRKIRIFIIVVLISVMKELGYRIKIE